jgi:hypothetical protein
MPKTSEDVLQARRNVDIESLAAGSVGEAIVALGKKGLQYSEAKATAKAKKDNELLVEAKGVLTAFFEGSDARHMTKAQLLDLFRHIRSNNTEKLKVKGVHAESWDESMACRYRNLLHHANYEAKKPESNKKLARWFKQLNLPGIGDDEDCFEPVDEETKEEEGNDEDDEESEDLNDDEDDKVAKKPAAGHDDEDDEESEDLNDDDEDDKVAKKPAGKDEACDEAWLCSWNDEFQMPERRKMNAKGVAGKPEMGIRPKKPKGAKDSDFVIATFADGTSAEIKTKTWADIKQDEGRRGAHEGAGGSGPLFEGVHSLTHNKIKVDQRTDRALLVSIYEGSRQVWQMCPWDLGDLPEEPKQPRRIPNENMVIQKSFNLIKPVLDQYIEGKIDLEKMKADLNEQLQNTRLRKTSMGKVGLANFLTEKGHPPPWYQGELEETKKRPAADASGTQTEQPPAKNRKRETKASKPDTKPKPAKSTAMKKSARATGPDDDHDDDDDADDANANASAFKSIGLRSSEGLSAIAKSRLEALTAKLQASSEEEL